MPIEDLNPEMQECLDKFQNAVFGEEVRNALIKAIELCYEDVINYVLSNVLKGDNGMSAYELAIQNGYSGTLKEWLESLKGPIGPVGPQGPPGEIEADDFTIDGTMIPGSKNPVQSSAIQTELAKKLNKNITSPTDVNKIVVVDSNGSIKASRLKNGANSFQNTDDLKKNTLSTEYGVKTYTYSKTESDERYIQKEQIDSEMSSTSTNPVQNKVIKAALDNIQPSDTYSKTESDERYIQKEQIDSEMSSTSTNPVQNKVIKAALDNIQPSEPIDMDEVMRRVDEKLSNYVDDSGVYNIIDLVFSFDNSQNLFQISTVPILFIERYNDEYYGDAGETKYRYYLTYVDSLSEEYEYDPTSTHWHRIMELTSIFETFQWKCQNVNNLSHNADRTKYYPSVNCMEQYMASKFSNYTEKTDFEFLENDYKDLEARVRALENK